MSFDPWNHLFKIQESIMIPTPKVGGHLAVWGFIPSHSPTLLGVWNVMHGIHSYWKNNLKTNKKWNIQGLWNETLVLTNKNHKGCMFQMLQSPTMACNN
jgi:hypothetical protein